MNTYAEKHKLLLENLTSIKQSNILNHSELKDKHIKLLELEISKLSDLQAIDGLSNSKRPQKTINRLKINCNTNVLADVFFQLMTEKTFEGKLYLEADIKEVTEFLCSNFTDKDGRELSQTTVKTMLSPSRYDKRPKGEKRIKLVND